MTSAAFLEIAQEAARAAGEVLEAWAGQFTVREKNPADLVTEADFAAQKVIQDLILARFPDHTFLGEEGNGPTDGDSAYRWIVDPLDGTSNYVHRFPYYCVSIALEHDGEMIVGVIFDPNRNEMFCATRASGATLNGQPITVSRVPELRDALVMASLPRALRGDDPAMLRMLGVMPHAQHIQRTGSAALNLAYVASGRIDAFWSSSLKPWDMAAGALLVAEAGGRVTRMNGGPFEVDVPDLLASNGTGVHDELQALLR